MTLDSFLSLLGKEVQDAYEVFSPISESFVIFSVVPSSRNLGFIDRSASSLSLTVAGQDLTIHQSPTILSSSREAGTTGAGMFVCGFEYSLKVIFRSTQNLVKGTDLFRVVLWKITPVFADWICDKWNIFFTHGILSPSSSVLELGSGSSALLALTLGARVGKFILSDQEYVLKLVQKNLDENLPTLKTTLKRREKFATSTANRHTPDISAISLDWETDSVRHHPEFSGYTSFSAVIACDTIYNEALVKPFVDTCVEACSLSRWRVGLTAAPAVAIVAQELRSPEVFEHWLGEFQKSFHTYRIPDSLLIPSLRPSSGYSVHVGILRSEAEH